MEDVLLCECKKTFNHDQCWEVVKNCSRFRMIPTCPIVVLNETPLHDSPASNSHLDSPMSQDAPIQKESRPIGRKAAKAKKWSNSSSNPRRREGNSSIICKRKGVCTQKKNIEKKDRETMAMDTSHMSHETKQFWKLD
ncbi:unnamed protein product, partial [Prunus brigantina]